MNGHEWLALWYLRLNGYFTLPNFIAHGRPGTLTEVDVLGVRFPHSEEPKFKDDPGLKIPNDRIDIVFAEVKGKKIEDLNGPWSSPEKGALDYVLKRVGVAPAEQVKGLATDLYKKRNAEIDGYRIRIVCFADTISDGLLKQDVTFISWAQALDFIRNRFQGNARLKQDHEAWDDFGKYLWTALVNDNVDADGLFHGWDTRSRGTNKS
jgi:hypothetical protein